MEQNSKLIELPADLQKQLCLFLGAQEASIGLSFTCKDIYNGLGISLLKSHPPHLTLDPINSHEQGNSFVKGPEIPILFRYKTALVTFCCKWKDQGWGNRKGRIEIREGDRKRMVAKSPTAEHSKTNLCLTFEPKHNEKYYIYFLVGGGGGHSLHVTDIRIKQLIYDGLSTAKIYNQVLYLNRVNVADMFSLDMIEYLVDDIEADSSRSARTSSKLIHYCGVEADNEESLASLKEIVVEMKRHVVMNVETSEQETSGSPESYSDESGDY